MQSSLFRKDIQGLRGIAIFFVLIFHFYPDIFSKGFLGVDLFFVISGYLLTFIYFKKKISHFDFFARRLKRLLIPILAITFFSILLATFLLLPVDLSNFWNSVLTTVFFVSNFYFLLTGGYFGGINELKPFIHMWSLAMEMQFYFVYTILLLLISKFFKKNYILFIFFLTFTSFFLYLFLISYEKNELAFFLLPTRLWEFLFGSVVYFIPIIKIHKRLNYIIYVFAIFIIFILVAAYKLQITDLTRQFLVVFFVGLVIYAGTKIKNDNLLLGNSFFQFLGKISYSTYLVHWPILVFVKYYLVRDISDTEKFILLLIVLFLSYFFWLFIEKKFRYKFDHQKIWKVYFISLSIIFLLFAINFINKSFIQRINKDILIISNSIDSNYRCDLFSYIVFQNTRNCKVVFDNKKNSYNIILLGNSHAQMYGYAFEKILQKKNLNGLIIPENGCLPTTTINITKDCIITANKNLNKIIKNKDINFVFIGLNWDHESLKDINNNNVDNINNLALSKSLYELIKNLESHNIKTALIGPVSEPNYKFSSIASRNLHYGHTKNFNNFKETKIEFENRFFGVFDFFNSKKYENFIKPHLLQCGSGKCLFVINGNSLFSDHSHLSKYGSFFMQALLQKEIEKFYMKYNKN